MKKQWQLILMLVVAIVVVLFALQNTGEFTLSFFTWKFKVPVVLIILVSVLVGVILGLLNSMDNHRQLRRLKKNFDDEVNERLKGLKGQVKELEQDLDKVRAENRTLTLANQAEVKEEIPAVETIDPFKN